MRWEPGFVPTGRDYAGAALRAGGCATMNAEEGGTGMSENEKDLPSNPLEQANNPPPPLPDILQRPIHIGSLDRPIDLVTCREFWSLTGGSILYCLSAMCAIYGFSAMLGPVFSRTFVLGEALPGIVGLNVYELALLTVLVVIVVWQEVTDDAISLVVLLAIFLAVSGLALTTISNSQPSMVLLIGAGCLALAMGKVWVLRCFVGMDISGVLWAGLAGVLGWNFLVGARLAPIAAKTVGKEQWLVSWLVLLSAGVIVVLDAALRRRETVERTGTRVAFLHRPAMGWIFAMVLLAAAGVHQRALAYVFDVHSTTIDYLPLVSVLAMLGLQLALHLRSKAGYLEAGLAAAPLGVFLWMLSAGDVLDKPVVGIQLLWYPPVFLGLTGIAVLVTGMRARSRAIVGVAPFYALGVVLTLTTVNVVPRQLHWELAGALLVAGLMVMGLVRRSVALCLAAVVAGTIGLANTGAFLRFASAWELTQDGAAVGLAGVGTLAVGLALGRMHKALMIAGALGVMVCAFDFMPPALGMRNLFAAGVLLAMGAGVWMRLRCRPAAVILVVPIWYRMGTAFTQLSSWRYVLLGFVLLAAGAWVSIRKGKRARREAGVPEARLSKGEDSLRPADPPEDSKQL